MCISDEQRKLLHDLKDAMRVDAELGGNLNRVAPKTWGTAADGADFSKDNFNPIIEAVIREACPGNKGR